jgi:hypothetical protein
MARKNGKGEPESGARERLLVAALESFNDKGYAAASVREIVEAAGVRLMYAICYGPPQGAHARPEVIRSENGILTAKERLRLVLALDGGDIDVTGSLESPLLPPPPFQESLTTARRLRPELSDLR